MISITLGNSSWRNNKSSFFFSTKNKLLKMTAHYQNLVYPDFTDCTLTVIVAFKRETNL